VFGYFDLLEARDAEAAAAEKKKAEKKNDQPAPMEGGAAPQTP
jgi:hypothetical protein